MTAPDPRANPLLLGHDAAEAVMAEAMRSGRMHHAWLITGPEGIGKATLAFRFARRLFAGPVPGGSLAVDEGSALFRRVASGRADPDQARLVGGRPLDAWVDVWHGLTRLQDETEGLNLDKRQAILAGCALLAGR